MITGVTSAQLYYAAVVVVVVAAAAADRAVGWRRPLIILLLEYTSWRASASVVLNVLLIQVNSHMNIKHLNESTVLFLFLFLNIWTSHTKYILHIYNHLCDLSSP